MANKQEEKKLKQIASKAKAQAKDIKTQAKKAQKKAAAPKAKGAKSDTTRPTTAKATGLMIASEPKAASEQPPFRHEVHLKKNEITVLVTLNKIPPQHIAIDETTDDKLVVDTSKHTKKFRLEFPFPSGMKVDAEAAEYEFEHGQLKCVFKVTSMPKAVLLSVENKLNSVRKSQKMRFETDKDGDMIVRSRRTVMTRAGSLVTDEAKAAKAKAKAAEAKGEVVDKDGLESAVDRADKNATEKATKKSAGKKDAAPAKAGKKSKQADVLSAEKKKMLQLASEVASKSDKSLKEKLAKARELHASRLTRTATSTSRKDVKTERMAFAFERIVSEKQKRIADATEARAIPEKKANKGKAVKFA